MRGEHPVVAVAEVQVPPPPLAQVLLVQVGGILVPLRPVLDVAPRPIRRHTGHLRQQIPIRVDRFGAGGRGGPGQSVGMLGRDVASRQRPGHVGHLCKRVGTAPPPTGLTLRGAGVAAQHLHRIHTTVVEALQGGHGPRFGRIGPCPHTTQHGDQRPQHVPPRAAQ